MIGSPCYHGGISGLVKNAIDLLEDLRLDQRPYLDGRAVGLVVVAGGWQAGGITLSALRGIVHALRGWPTPLGIAVNTVEQKPLDQNGVLAGGPVMDQVQAMANQIFALIGDQFVQRQSRK